jgi:hypothetical protein
MGKAAERSIFEAYEKPGLDQAGAQATVKFDSRGIPVKDVPGHLAAPFPDCDARHSGHQRLARALAALVWQHEEVFDEKDGAAGERRISEIIKRESDRASRLRADQGIKVAAAPEAVAAESLCVRAKPLEEALVFRESTDEPYDDRRVARGGGPDAQGRVLLTTFQGSY